MVWRDQICGPSVVIHCRVCRLDQVTAMSSVSLFRHDGDYLGHERVTSDVVKSNENQWWRKDRKRKRSTGLEGLPCVQEVADKSSCYRQLCSVLAIHSMFLIRV